MKLNTPGYVPPYMRRNGAFDKLRPIWTRDMYQFLLSGVGVYLFYRLFHAMAEGFAETGAYRQAGWFTPVLTWFVERSGPVWIIAAVGLIYLLIYNIVRGIRLRKERWWTSVFFISLLIYDALMLAFPFVLIALVKSLIGL